MGTNSFPIAESSPSPSKTNTLISASRPNTTEKPAASSLIIAKGGGLV